VLSSSYLISLQEANNLTDNMPACNNIASHLLWACQTWYCVELKWKQKSIFLEPRQWLVVGCCN